MSTYSKANRTAQWYGNTFSSASFKPNCGVLHTTEGTGFPTYSGGSMAPNYTANPNMAARRLDFRAHFEDEKSSRALENRAGGVETNRANAIQVELVGTCDATYSNSRKGWGTAGVDYIYWPDAPEWAMDQLADFLVDMNRRHGIPLQGPAMWLSYGKDARAPGRVPASYGKSPARFSFAQWQSFYGWCGHQHVPENDHGDPGSLDAARLFQIAKAKLAGKPTTPTTAPTKGDPLMASIEQLAKITADRYAVETARNNVNGERYKLATQRYNEQNAAIAELRAAVKAQGERITALENPAV